MGLAIGVGQLWFLHVVHAAKLRLSRRISLWSLGRGRSEGLDACNPKRKQLPVRTFYDHGAFLLHMGIAELVLPDNSLTVIAVERPPFHVPGYDPGLVRLRGPETPHDRMGPVAFDPVGIDRPVVPERQAKEKGAARGATGKLRRTRQLQSDHFPVHDPLVMREQPALNTQSYGATFARCRC